MDQLDASEPEVAAALLKWGLAQLQAEDSSDIAKLRQTVDFGLKSIRFTQLDAKQFANLCQGDLGLVLSGEEKFQILDCIVQNKWDEMPVQLGPLHSTLRTRLSFSLDLKMHFADLVSAKGLVDSNWIPLSVDKRVCFVGLRFVPSDLTAAACANLKPSCMKVQVKSCGSEVILGKCNPDNDVFKLDKDCVLNAGCLYKLRFEFPKGNGSGLKKLHATYKIDAECKPKVEWEDGQVLTVSINLSNAVGVNVAELMFKRLE